MLLTGEKVDLLISYWEMKNCVVATVVFTKHYYSQSIIWHQI